jgi:metal-dependent amidase/aminoacylase/carboxypeptidase family protein
VGAAEALAAVAGDLGIGIRVLGTPAEEGGGGKIPMLEAGCFDGLAFAMMIHPGPADAVYARPRAVAHFDVAYRGIASHAGAYPHLGRNAADAFTIAQVAIGLLRQQLEPSVRVHGIVTEAGTAPNAIPETARGSWYVDLAETGPRGMTTASTDMGNVSQRVRAIHPYLGIGSLPAVNHQPAFAAATVTPAGDQAVRDGAVLLAQTAIDAVLGALSLDQDRWIRSAARSATTMTVTTGFTEVSVGNTEASATRRPATPWTRNRESTTAPGSSDRPIRQVPLTW